MHTWPSPQIATPARLLACAGQVGADAADSSEMALHKRLAVVLCVGTLPLTMSWSAIYLLAGVPSAAAIPAFYSLFTPINTLFFAWSRNLELYRFSQLLMILILPCLVTLSLGGFGPSSMVIIWAALCPLAALLLEDVSRTLFWILGFLALLLVTATLQPYLVPARLPEAFVTWFFVLNVGCVIAIVFGLLHYFVGQLTFFQDRSERLLLNILPREISEALKAERRTIAAHYDAASILFADIVEFTPMAAAMTPLRLVDLLNEVFQCFDALVEKYDLEKIKDRILEYLAVKKLRQERLAEAAAAAADIASTETPAPNTQSETPTDRVAREPILCFVGPPGVGKTSLGQSIARALGRKFVRISLGGVHDEAEIRGHRRTYIGALPGRIIQAIRRAEARDPVFMLDEIDKVASDWRGDPSSALLEVLDPAQNHSFTDNYLGVGFDLSQVLFLTTANTLDTIPAPLRDRMEVLQLSGYTDAEKVQIATTYLVPKQLTAHGLRPEELTIQEDALRAVIRGYTREAGVRNLDREIASLCRKVAREIAEGHIEPKVLTGADVVRYLGRQRFIDEVAERTQRPGVATGLAWTPTGGDVLFVEATCMPSRNEQLILTGMLGDVMRESAQAALSYIRAYGTQVLAPAAGKNGQAGKNGSNGSRRASARNDMPTPPCADLDGSVFEGATIHLHVPAGAIPKDGPSAGVTMLTALASLATGRPVRSDLAMTGELTLRGKVLPIGGVKEKVLAAHRAGIKTILLPRQNERELEEDVPQDLRDSLKIVFVDTAEEVLENALEPAPRQDSGGASKARGKTSARSKAATA